MQQRSPFGELVRRYRRNLGLSQEALAQRINELVNQGDAGIEGRISAKTIFNHEAKWDDAARFHVPRVGTIGIYADAFGLARGSAERRQLVEAAEETRRLKEAATAGSFAPAPPTPDAPLSQSPLSAGFALAGREHAWDTLRRALDLALAGHPQIALLQGEAGIGKTRLLIELGRQAERADARLSIAWGRFISPSPAPYYAVREVLSLLIGNLRGVGTPQWVSSSTGHRLRERAPDAIEALLRDAPSVIGSLIAPDALSAQAAALHLVNDYWRHLFERLPTRPVTVDSGVLNTQVAGVLRRYASAGPLVVVFDDLHWASVATLQLITLLARLLRDATNLPLLLVAAFRPEAAQLGAQDTAPLLTALLTDIHRTWSDGVIDLAPSIDPVHGRAYVDGRLDLTPNRLDAAFREALFATTAGLPIFVENALWALRSRGQLAPDANGALTFRGNVHDLDLPPSTMAMIGERLARIETDARTALEIAAVQGEQFFAEPLIAAMRLAAPAASRLFDTVLVKQARLVTPAGALTVAGTRLHRYLFAHALYRDYLFQHLGIFQREAHQLATARALDDLVGATHTELSASIADLYEQAGDRAAAAHHHRLAGIYDLDTRHPESARGHFARAIALADPHTQAEEIGQAMLGDIRGLRMAGESRQAAIECQRAIAFSRAQHLPDIETYALIWLGLLSYDLGVLRDAEEHFLTALPMLRTLGDLQEECRTEGLLAHVLYGLGRYEEAMSHADRALALADGLRDDSLAAESRLSTANCLLDLGRYQDAIATFELAIERFRRAREMEGEGMARADIGLCLIGLERWTEAGRALHEARSIGKRLAAVRLLGHVELYQGLADEGRDAQSAAAVAYAKSLRLRRRADQTGFAIDSLAGLLRINLARRRYWYTRRIVWGIGRYLEQRGAEGIEEPLRVAESCVAALFELNQAAEARRLLGASVALLRERAAHISSPNYRTSYLDEVPHNRTLLRRAAEDGMPEHENTSPREITS